jgi:hypothetical protein
MSKPTRPNHPRGWNQLRTLDNRELLAVAGGDVARARVYFKSGGDTYYAYGEVFLIEGHTDACG